MIVEVLCTRCLPCTPDDLCVHMLVAKRFRRVVPGYHTKCVQVPIVKIRILLLYINYTSSILKNTKSHSHSLHVYHQ